MADIEFHDLGQRGDSLGARIIEDVTGVNLKTEDFRESCGDPDALAGRKVAVVKGSAHEAFLAALFPKAERIGFDTGADAEAALKNGSADLLFGDGVRLAFWLQSEPAAGCCAFAGGPYLEPHFFGEGFAIALPPDRTDLRRAIDWALDSLYDKGVFAELYLRYFPVGYF